MFYVSACCVLVLVDSKLLALLPPANTAVRPTTFIGVVATPEESLRHPPHGLKLGPLQQNFPLD